MDIFINAFGGLIDRLKNRKKKRKEEARRQEILKGIRFVYIDNAKLYTLKTIQKHGYQPFYLLTINCPQKLLFTYNEDQQNFKIWDKYLYNQEQSHYPEVWTEVKLTKLTLDQLKALIKSYEWYQYKNAAIDNCRAKDRKENDIGNLQ